MRMRIDVWSDVACPWCWVGKRRLEQALAEIDEEPEVVWHAFELDPSAPRVRDPATSYVERLAKKYRTSVAQAQGMIDRMTTAGAEDGLTFRFDHIQSGNTFDAHRLLHLAHTEGKQNELKERFFEGYFEEGKAIGEPAALSEMAVDVGLDEAAVTRLLETDELSKEVRQDQAEARSLGVTGVPFFVFAKQIAFSGAQPKEVIAEVLAKARAQDVQVEGAACGPDGC